jgi:predicted NBD/HSP70 family sugar kinase
VSPQSPSELDNEARALLASRLGDVVRRASGAAACGRRQRWEAMATVIALAKHAPDLIEVIAHASRLAWQDRLRAITASSDATSAIRTVAELLTDVARSRE